MPANVHLLRGNPSKKPIAALLDEFKPEVEMPDFPGWLWPEAKKEWKRIAPLLEKYGLVSQLEREPLVVLCQAWAKYVWAERMLARSRATAEKEREEFDADEERLAAQAKDRGESYARRPWTGGDGVMVPTPNGSLQYSHYWVVSTRASRELQSLWPGFGILPSSRGRVTLSDNYPFLPGMEPGLDKDSGEQQQATKPTLAQLIR